MRRLKIFLTVFVLFFLHSNCANNQKDIQLIKQGKVLLAENKYTEAIPVFTKAIHKNFKNDDAHAYRGYTYYLLEKYQEAMRDFENALSQNPANETALFGQACINWNVENFASSFKEFNQLLQINPKHDKAYFYRGRAFLHYGDTNKGLNDLSAALNIDSCFLDTYYLLSSVLTSQKKYNEADQILQKALKCKQENSGN